MKKKTSSPKPSSPFKFTHIHNQLKRLGHIDLLLIFQDNTPNILESLDDLSWQQRIPRKIDPHPSKGFGMLKILATALPI